MNKERIQKALARQGLGSRRQIEIWISEDKIQLNGELAQLGDHVKPGDIVMFSGRKIIIKSTDAKLPRVIAYHKPEGQVCSRSDPEGRPTIFDSLPGLKHSRWVAIGRLDLNTSGLILLTDEGELANRLMHPSRQVQREYAVRTLGTASDEMLYKLTHGVQLEDGMARFEEIVDSGGLGTNHWYHVVLMEGRNREVRRMWEAIGLKVSRLMRVRFGPVILNKSQRPGKTRELTEKQVIELASMVDLHYELPEKPNAEKSKDKPAKTVAHRKPGPPRGKKPDQKADPKTRRSRNNKR
ncbi:MAG: 23S rRNA pseudouridine(2605) synthase RluB [Gammaproteobacteria bacterium]